MRGAWLLTHNTPRREFDPLNDDWYERERLHRAAESGDLAAVKKLLAEGYDVNAHDEKAIGETPLGLIAATCSPRTAEVLLQVGVDPTIPGWMQLTALRRARERKKADGVRVYELMLKCSRS